MEDYQIQELTISGTDFSEVREQFDRILMDTENTARNYLEKMKKDDEANVLRNERLENEARKRADEIVKRAEDYSRSLREKTIRQCEEMKKQTREYVDEMLKRISDFSLDRTLALDVLPESEDITDDTYDAE